MKLSINLNDTFDVELTAFGAKVYNEHYLEYPATCRPATVTAGARMVLQLWNLMQVFGPHLYVGATEMPFKDNTISRDKIA